MRDRISGVVLLAVAVFLYTQTFDIRTPGRARGVGPEVWPQMLLIALAALSVWIIVNSFRGQKAKNEPPLKLSADDLRVGIAILLSLLYAFTLESVGYLVSTAIIVACLAALMGQTNRVTLVAVPVALSVVSGMLFLRMGVLLPHGEGIFRSLSVMVLGG